MKALKTLLHVTAVVVIVAAGVLVDSCAKSEDFVDPDNLAGTWRLRCQSFDGVVEYTTDDQGFTLTFNSDKTVTTNEYSASGTPNEPFIRTYTNPYSYDGSTKCLTVEFETKQQIFNVLTLSRTKMEIRDAIIYYDPGNDRNFTRVRVLSLVRDS